MYLDKIWGSDTNEEGEDAFEGRQPAFSGFLINLRNHYQGCIIKILEFFMDIIMKLCFIQIVFLNIYKKKGKEFALF